MFISRFLTAMATGLVVTSAAHAEPSIRVEANSAGSQNVVILLDRGSALANRITEALVQSPMVKEVVNPWVQPKSLYDGDGFQLNLIEHTGGHHISLRLQLTAVDKSALTVQGPFLHVDAQAGAIQNLRKALLASTSSHVLTKSNPGSISPQDGDAIVLEGTNFAGSSISCRSRIHNPEISMCTFDLKK